MNKFFVLIVLALSFVLVGFNFFEKKENLSKIEQVEKKKVMSTLLELGNKQPNHFIEKTDPILVKKGEQLIFKGQIDKGVFKSKKISTYFVCVDCHSTKRETRNTKLDTPEERLDYSMKNNQPYLPASTFWGMYNRKSWYNGDYVKKYGNIINDVKDDLRKSIDFCANYCSAGRNLKEWEIEAVLHYLKSLELSIKDIPLDGNTKMDLSNIDSLTKRQREKISLTIENSYTSAVPATFLPTLPVEKRGMGKNGNPVRGKYLYNQACMYCHQGSRVTFLNLEEDQLSVRMFMKNLDNYTDESIYQIVRQGTYTMAGRNQYMPLYTKERMSDSQIEDIVTYLKTLAKK
ncbi:MAG: mono/diheme cytochrome c family protein [Lentimonas sp.]|jgi:mono/diheme cytochrome c family protein